MAEQYYTSSWRLKIVEGIEAMFKTEEMSKIISQDHVDTTPVRYLNALDEYFAGVFKDPRGLLTKALFNGNGYDEMIHVSGDKFYSMCMHHLAPFFGKYHFAYVPNGQVIGLSKIPRLVEIFARRPQVQENLCEDIVEAFYDIVKPKGCAIKMIGTHFCMEARGVQAHGAVTTTTALRGCFRLSPTRDEFLLEAGKLEWRI